LVHLPTTLPNAAVPDLALAFFDTLGTQEGLGSVGQRYVFEVGVDPGLPFRVTLTHTDRPGRGQQDDIFLIVEEPEPPTPSQKYLGNEHLAEAGNPDRDNNVETIRIDQPVAGTYRVYVVARNLLVEPGQQHDFALVVCGKLVSELQRVAR
jgi:hypothetical protein